MLYIRTEDPIYGRIFYMSAQGELETEKFHRDQVDLTLDFSWNGSDSLNIIEFYVHRKADARLLQARARLLQKDSFVLRVSNRPIEIEPAQPEPEKTPVTSLQYFLYIGVPIIVLVVLGCILFTCIFIFRKIRMLKLRAKGKKRVGSSTDLSEKEAKKRHSGATTKNHIISDIRHKQSDLSKPNSLPVTALNAHRQSGLPSDIPLMYVLPQPQMVQSPMGPVKAVAPHNGIPFVFNQALVAGQSNVNSIHLNSDLPNHYDVGGLAGLNSAQNSHQVASSQMVKHSPPMHSGFKRALQSEPKNLKAGPVMRSNTIRPARVEAEEFGQSFRPSDVPVQRAPFGNELRLADEFEMPPDAGELPLFEVQLKNVPEYTPGTKFG